jgi:hydrogenase maturation protease
VTDVTGWRPAGPVPPSPHAPDTIVVGLGNPILGDDGVGWRVIDELEARAGSAAPGATWPTGVTLDRVCVGGVALMERLTGFQRAIIVDAILEPEERPGAVWRRPLSEVVTRTASHLDSTHDATLPAAMAAGRLMGASLPDDVDVVGITITRADVFGEKLSRPVAEAVAPAARLIEVALEAREARAGGDQRA